MVLRMNKASDADEFILNFFLASLIQLDVDEIDGFPPLCLFIQGKVLDGSINCIGVSTCGSNQFITLILRDVR